MEKEETSAAPEQEGAAEGGGTELGEEETQRVEENDDMGEDGGGGEGETSDDVATGGGGAPKGGDSSGVEGEEVEGEVSDNVVGNKVSEEDDAISSSEVEEHPGGKRDDGNEGGDDEEEEESVQVESQQVEDDDDDGMEIDETVGEEEEGAGEEDEEGIRAHRVDRQTPGEDEGLEEEEHEESAGDGDQTGPPAPASTIMTRKRTLSQSSGEDGPRRKVGRSASTGGSGGGGAEGEKQDKYCWVCHKESVQNHCKLCPRSYHLKCVAMDYPTAKVTQSDSTCPECVVVMNAETKELRSDAMKQLSVEQLMGLLKNICLRMRQTPGSDPFIRPVDPADAEDYFDYIIYPMDIETLEKNIKKRLYGSTEAFLADAQWLVHNSIVFNSASSHYTVAAKRLLKVCKQELTEIETCPECYTNAHEKPEQWFTEACRRPHLLVWAKLKGFPFWPAKAMKIQNTDVDVRFFGQHDRAWVATKDCFLYSDEMPVAPPKKNGPLLAAIEELTAHVEKLKAVHGPVVFASAKTRIGPALSVEEIRKMLPEYNPPEQPIQKGSNQQPPSSKNNNNKTPPPKGKSPMTIRISSLKTNPTIVNISAVENSPEGGRVTRLTRKSSALSASNVSESEASTEDQLPCDGGDVKMEEEDKTVNDDDAPESEETKPVPEKKEAEEDSGGTASVPKGSEILANALGIRRSTRGSSRSGDSSTNATPTSNPSPAVAAESIQTTSATPQLEKRLTRGALKAADPINDPSNDGEGGSDEQPPDSVLEAMGLSKKTKDAPPPSANRPVPAAMVIKGEPQDLGDGDDDLEEATAAAVARSSNKTAHSLMEQISVHTAVKPGYRFNLSKDISISAVEGADLDDMESGQAGGGAAAFMRQRRALLTTGGVTSAATRGVPQGIPMAGVGVGATRPRLPLNPTGTVNGGAGQQRMFTGQQLRQMVRNARPQQILNPRTGVRITGNANRPVTMMTVRAQQQAVQKSTKDHQGVVVDSSTLRIEGQSVNPVQGPITLPGGTITVTPLSSLIAGVPITAYGGDGVNGAQAGQVAVALKTTASAISNNIGIINVQQQQSGGTTIVNNAMTTAKGVKAIQPAMATAQQRRNLMVSIPPSVNMHLQNLTKTMGDLVKSTIEQITVEIVEFCNNTQGKTENSRLQLEVDRLQSKLKQEVTDVKHNNDIAMRELRMTMENDKKRALAEAKRQFEAEKQKAVEDTKKKQWCANCGREALFYCCWNTSYCGYPCQEEHWPTHMSSCSQSSTNSR